MRGVCAVFDIDDTLYLERDYVRSGFEAVGRWAADWLSIEDFADRCWSRFAAGHRRSTFDAVLRECGISPAPELISALIEIYRAHIPRIELLQDALEALDWMTRAGSVAIVTDGPIASQSRKADALGLHAYAQPIVLTEVLGSEFRKPHPRAFEHVQERREAAVYIYIADNPQKDFAAPKHLGWVTVRVRRPGGLHYEAENPQAPADLEVRDCSGIPELVGQL